MIKHVAPLALFLLTACASDPLEVQYVTTDETAPADGLTAAEITPAEEGWTEEDGVLSATAPASLTLAPDRAAFTLAFSLNIEEGTEARLRFGADRAIDLHSLALANGAEPEDMVTITPGMWNRLEVAYQPATQRSPALLVAAYLNGNLVHYQQELGPAGGAEASGPITLELSEGTLAVTNIRGSDRAGMASRLTSSGEVLLNLPLIHYAYYEIEDKPDDVTDWGRRTPDKEGYIGRFDLNAIRERQQDYAIRFDSELDIPKADAYTFSIFSPTSTRLYIDDQLVVDLGGRDGENYAEGTIELSEGTHQLRMDHYQYSGWNRLDVRYKVDGDELLSLNDMANGRSIATPPGTQVVEVEMDDRPYLLRSFLHFPPARVYDFTDKRTHVVNVGEGQGPHYSYDLSTGSLLQAWRGPFVDVSDMWVGRGEPQVARALAPVVALDGAPQWAAQSDTWPDSVADLRHRRYELDEAGRPTFHFTLGGSELSDRIEPAGQGLVRTLTNGSSEALYTQLAASSRIRELGPGSFELVDPGLRIEVEQLAAGGLRLLRGKGRERLVAQLPPGESVRYRLDW